MVKGHYQEGHPTPHHERRHPPPWGTSPPPRGWGGSLKYITPNIDIWALFDPQNVEIHPGSFQPKVFDWNKNTCLIFNRTVPLETTLELNIFGVEAICSFGVLEIIDLSVEKMGTTKTPCLLLGWWWWWFGGDALWDELRMRSDVDGDYECC